MGIYNLRAVRWTDAEDRHLAALWAEGLSAGLIAEQFHNRSRNSIIGRVHRLGLQNRVEPRPLRVANAQRRPRPVYQMPDPERLPRDPCARCNVRGDMHAEHGCGHYRRGMVA